MKMDSVNTIGFPTEYMATTPTRTGRSEATMRRLPAVGVAETNPMQMMIDGNETLVVEIEPTATTAPELLARVRAMLRAAKTKMVAASPQNG